MTNALDNEKIVCKNCDRHGFKQSDGRYKHLPYTIEPCFSARPPSLSFMESLKNIFKSHRVIERCIHCKEIIVRVYQYEEYEWLHRDRNLDRSCHIVFEPK